MGINKTTLCEVNTILCEENTIKVLAWPKDKNSKNNPYNFILYSAMPERVQVTEFHPRKMKISSEDIFHIHWPDMLLRSRRWWRIVWRFIRLLKTIKRFQSRGGKVVWTVHNLKPHLTRFPSLSDMLMRKFLHRVDGLIFLTESSRNEFLVLYPEFEHIRYRIIPHAHYRSYYPHFVQGDIITGENVKGENVQDDVRRDTVKGKSLETNPINIDGLSSLSGHHNTAATGQLIRKNSRVNREQLGITDGEPLILMFGKIRAHKGLNDLLAAKKKLNHSKLHLLVAGNPGDDGIDKLTAETLKKDRHCHTFFEHVVNERVCDYFTVSDAVILPYTDILNSGTAILALSFGVPIIAPAMGSLISLNKTFSDEWVFLYDRPLTAKTLDKAMVWVKTPRDALPDLSGLEPETVSNRTLAFYSDLLNCDE